jgi:hypothetical protein
MHLSLFKQAFMVAKLSTNLQIYISTCNLVFWSTYIFVYLYIYLHVDV